MILINAAIELPKIKTYYGSKKNNAERFVPGIASDIKKPQVTELAYDKTPVKSMGDLIELTDLVKMNLSKITVPTLIFSSITDHVVPTEKSHYINNNINSNRKTMIELNNSYHFATYDNNK